MPAEEPNQSSFRKLKTYPTIEDIIRVENAELLENLQRKAYNSCDHYFETQFRLLREELVRPLINSVHTFRVLVEKYEENHNYYNSKSKTFNELLFTELDFNVYTGIQVLGINVNYNCGVVLTLTLDHELLQDVDWSESNKLMDGSLLCLSSDKFRKSLFFGIIAKRSIKDYETHEMIWEFDLQLDFDNNNFENMLEMVTNMNCQYIAIESSTYYEGFRHTLTKLQEMNGIFPLKEYIVDVDVNVKPPPYLDEESVYDMTCISKQNNKTEELEEINKPNALSTVKPLKVNSEQKNILSKLSTFDCMQFEAFFTALTKQLALIQGPPGTGKTFVGLKIVKCLLDNSHIRNENQNCAPILIVCYKNHALDQFLEGILKFCDKVVRIGSKSESQELKPFILSNMKREVTLQMRRKPVTGEMPVELKDCQTVKPELRNAIRKERKYYYRINEIKQQIEKVYQKIRSCFIRIVEFENIKPFIMKKYLNQLNINTDCSESDWQRIMEEWLKGTDIVIVNPEENVDIEEKMKNFSESLKRNLNKKIDIQSFDDVLNVKNIYELKVRERLNLYLLWREKYLLNLKKELKQLSLTVKTEVKYLDIKRNKSNQELCKDSLIIGLTITGAAKHRSLVEALSPKVMIVEEAAEVLEGHVMAAIATKVEHLILIGDHQQLRPITNDRQLSDDYKLDISMFERMVDINIDPKKLKHFKQLTLQHRMRPCISELLKVAEIYKELRNDVKVTKYPEMKFTFKKDMFFLNHNNFEDSNNTREVVDRSRSNLFEAKIVIELVKHFLLRNYKENQITVLTTYNAQLRLIKALMFEQKEIFVKPKEEETIGSKTNEEKDELKVRVSSVDGFQGEENDIIIISFVRSSKKEDIGFLNIKNRVCVALSRARHGLYCVGNFKYMAKRSDMWKRIVDYLKDKQFYGEELTVGCDCFGEQFISMPEQFGLYNLQTKNRGECDCLKNNRK